MNTKRTRGPSLGAANILRGLIDLQTPCLSRSYAPKLFGARRFFLSAGLCRFQKPPLRGWSFTDAADFKQYIFPLLFFKRISDVWDIDKTTRTASSLINEKVSHAQKKTFEKRKQKLPSEILER